MYLSPFQKSLKYGVFIIMYGGIIAISGITINALQSCNTNDTIIIIVGLTVMILLALVLNYGLNIILKEELFRYKKQLKRDYVSKDCVLKLLYDMNEKKIESMTDEEID